MRGVLQEGEECFVLYSILMSSFVDVFIECDDDEDGLWSVMFLLPEEYLPLLPPLIKEEEEEEE